jgi:hypothetical protein
MRLFFLFAITLFSFLETYGQVRSENVTVSSFPVFKLEERSVPLEIIGFDSTGYYMLYGDGKYGNKENSIVKFDLNLTPTGQAIDILNIIKEPNIQTIKILKIENQLFHILVKNEPKSRTYYYEKIDLKAFTISPREFMTKVVVGEGNMKKSGKAILVSPDKSQIALFYTLPVKNNDSEKMEAILFDKNFKQVEKRVFEFSIINKQFLIQNVFLTNSGIFYLLATKTFSTNVLSDLNTKRYKHIIYKLDKNKPQKLGEILNNSHHLRQIAFFMANDNKLIVSGFYSDKNLFSIKGIFYLRMDVNTHEILQSNFIPLSEQYYTETLDSYAATKIGKKYSKGKLEDKYMVIQQIVEYKNGDIGLIAEQMYTYTIYGATTYYHMDFAVVRVNPEGKITWAKKIAKENSKGGTPIYSVNKIFMKNDKLFIVYNDNIANLNHTKGEIVKTFGGVGVAFIMVKVNSEGDYQRQLIKDERSMDGQRVRPKFSTWIDSKTLLIFTQNTTSVKTQQFLKLEFTEN